MFLCKIEEKNLSKIFTLEKDKKESDLTELNVLNHLLKAENLILLFLN